MVEFRLWKTQTYHKFGDAAFSLTRFFKDRDTLGGPLKPSSAVGTATGLFVDLDTVFVICLIIIIIFC